MKISGDTIEAAISDAGLVVRSHHVRDEGEVYIVAKQTPGPATTIALREPEMEDQFIVFGRIQNAARALRPDD